MALNGLLNFGVIFRARSNISQVVRQVTTGVAQARRAIGSLDRVNALGNKASIFDKQRFNEQQDINRGLSEVGVPLLFTASLIKASSEAANLEDRLTGVQIVAEELKKTNIELQRSFVGISNNTSVAAEELANVGQIVGTSGLLGQMSRLGFSAKKINDTYFDLIDTVAKFSVVSKQSTVVTGRQISEVALQLRLFEQGPGVFKRFVSAIQLVGKNSASEGKQVLEFVKALVPVRNSTRLTEAQLIGLAGAVKGFGGEVSKHLVKTTFDTIYQKASTNLDVFAKALGMSRLHLQKLIDENPGEFFFKLLKHLNGLSSSSVRFSEELQKLGLGARRIRPFLSGAIKQIDLIRTLTDMANEEMNGLGNTLEKDFAKAMESVNKKARRFLNLIRNISILIGSTTLGVFKKFFTILNTGFGALASFLATGPGRVVATATAFATLAAGASVLSTNLIMLANALGINSGIGVLFASLFSLFFKLTMVMKLLGPAFENVFGSGVSLFIENIQMIGSAVSKILKTGRLTISEFRELGNRGILGIVTGLVEAKDSIDSFIVGFQDGFLGAGRTFGDVFKEMVQDLFNVLNKLGIWKTEMSDGGNSMKNFGMIVGSVLRSLIDLMSWFLVLGLRVFKLLNTRVGRAIFGALGGSAAGLLTGGIPGAILGGLGGGALGAALPNLDTSRPTGTFKLNKPPGGSFPITGTTSGATNAEAMDRLAKLAEERIQTGSGIPASGRFGTLQILGDVNMSGEKVGKIMGEQKVDRAVSVGSFRHNLQYGFGGDA